MASTTEKTLSAILTLAAVVMAFAVVRREFIASRITDQSAVSNVLSVPEFNDEWRGLLAHGIEIGDSTAEVKIVEFVDLECPGCKVFHETILRPVKEQFGSSVSHVFIHLPLTMHRFADAAAVAAECAEQQRRFAEFVDIVFEKQDSIGLKTWISYAAEVAIPDTARFALCLDDPLSPRSRIQAGRTLADSLGISATPTVVVSGWHFRVPPSRRELTRVVTELMAGRLPFPTEGGP